MNTQDTIESPGVLLDYAHGPRRRSGLGVLLAPVIVTSVVALVALAAYVVTPSRYLAVGYVQVGAVPGFSCGPPRADERDVNVLRRDQADLVTCSASPDFRERVSTQLTQTGIEGSEADRIAATVSATAIDESRLVRVVAESNDAETARLAASLATRECCRLGRNGSVELIRRPELPDRGERNKLPALIAAVVSAIGTAGIYRLKD